MFHFKQINKRWITT